MRRWASLQEAADYLHVHHTTLRRYVSQGLVPCYRIGGRLRLDLNDIDAMGTPVPTVKGRA